MTFRTLSDFTVAANSDVLSLPELEAILAKFSMFSIPYVGLGFGLVEKVVDDLWSKAVVVLFPPRLRTSEELVKSLYMTLVYL